MGQAKIIIIVNEGNIVTKVTTKSLSQVDLSMLISHLELMRQDFLTKYKSNIKRFNKKEDE